MIGRLSNSAFQSLSVRVRQQGGREITTRTCEGREVDFKDEALNTRTNGCGQQRLLSVLYLAENEEQRSAVVCADDDAVSRWPRWSDPDATRRTPPKP